MKKFLSATLCVTLAACLSACKFDVLHPSGDIATQQRDLLIVSTLLMLLIIIPVMVATVRFAWHYRASNVKAKYKPDWNHSIKLELMIWACPLLIIICLGALTWVGTHLLDPYRPLNRITDRAEIAKDNKPLEVEVVALDWKWLFIYPEYGIATVNELAAPINRPINFRITSSSVMNAFYVPALAGMIYAMPGMETKLHAVINQPGDYMGFSANYSGAGFSNMKFHFAGLDQKGFDAWVSKAKSGNQHLGRTLYLTKLEVPSEKEPVAYYSSVDQDLYPAILNMCVDSSKMCQGMRMAIDARGGLGMEGIALASKLSYDKFSRRGSLSASEGEKTYISSICSTKEQLTQAIALQTEVPDTKPLQGYGLQKPDQPTLKRSGNFLAGIVSKPTPLSSMGPVTAMEGR